MYYVRQHVFLPNGKNSVPCVFDSSDKLHVVSILVGFFLLL